MNLNLVKNTLVKVLGVPSEDVIITDTGITNTITLEIPNVTLVTVLNKPESENISDSFVVARTTKGNIEPMWLKDNYNASYICNAIVNYYKDVMQLFN